MKNFAIAALVAGASLVSTAASAVPINGNFTVQGINPGGVVTTQFTGSPTSLTFTPAAPTDNASNSTAAATGDYAAAPFNFSSTTFNGPILNWPQPATSPNFFKLNIGGSDFTFSLDPTAANPAVQPSFTGTTNTVTLIAVGYVNFPGYDATPASFTFTTQKAVIGGVDTNTWSMSVASQGQPTGVPEIDALAGTGALTLLGGALALAGERRRRKA